MKKFYTFLLTAVLLIATAPAAFAQQRWGIVGSDGNGDGTVAGTLGWGEDDVVDGVEFAMQSGYLKDAAADFLSGTAKTTGVLTDNRYVFEVAPDQSENEEGYTIYMLKQVSTGLYLSSEKLSNTVSYTDSKTRAWKFCVRAAVTYADEDFSAQPLPEIETWITATKVENPTQNLLVLVDASCKTDTAETRQSDVTFLCSGTQGKAPSLASNYSYNAWEIFPIEEVTGYKWLQQVMAELFPDDDVSALYNVGENAGEISQELYDELESAFTAAKALIANASEDDAACQAAYERCVKAKQAAADGAIKIQEGYFYFRSGRTTENATYDNGEGLKWTYGQTWTKPDVLDMANAKYVWHLIPDADNSGAYFIQNYYTKRYVGVVHSRGVSVPTTETAEESYLIYPQSKDAFVIESTSLKEEPVIGYDGDGSPECTALHCPSDHNAVVVWTTTASASGWVFTPIPESEIEALEGLIAQDQLNNKLQDLYDKADAAYLKGFAYTSPATKDGIFTTVPGLVTDASQLFSNAKEESEGSYEALLDDDPETFFHSSWKNPDISGDNAHFLGVDLGQAVQNVQFKIAKRVNPGDKNQISVQFPKTLTIYACNDTLTSSTEAAQWVKQGTVTVTYDSPMYYEAIDSTYQNAVGFATIAMDQAYRFVRLDVTSNNGSKFFCFSGFQAYEATFDEANSMIEVVPAAVRQALETQMAQAKTEIEASAATQETYDALEKAYEDFLAEYPDPTALKALLAEAKAQISGAEEGSAPGYFQAGAIAELQAVVTANEDKVKDIMSKEDIESETAILNDALAVFASKLIVPDVDKYYYIQSESSSTDEGTPYHSYMYATGNGTNIKWTANTTDLALDELPQYVWKLEKQGTGYVFRNALTGEVINNPKQNDVHLSMSAQADTCAVTFRSAKVAGVFNIVLTDNVFVNAQPGYNNVVTWNEANGLDNSSFTFVEVDNSFSGYLDWPVAANKLQIVTLPVSVSVSSGDNCYSVIGRNGNNLELQAIDGTIEAGTPFFYQESEGSDQLQLQTVATSYEGLAESWVAEAKTVNGLTGTFAALSEIPTGYGILYQYTTIVNSKSGDTVGNNSGYLTPALPTTTETGDLQVPIDGTIDAIGTVTTSAAAQAPVSVYSLSGVKVRSNVKSASELRSLPAGIYLMGGKKVLVK